MTYVYDAFEHAGVRVEIHADDSGLDPFLEYDQLGTRVSWHSRYNMGREPDSDEMEALRRGGLPLLRRFLRMSRGIKHVKLLAMYDHSGVTVWTTEDVRATHGFDSAGWDSGVFGFIYADPADIVKMGTPEDRVMEVLEGEVKEWDDCLTGNVWGIVVKPHCEECEDRDESCDHGEVLDSVWGFIGEPTSEYIRSEAKDLADFHGEELDKRNYAMGFIYQ